MSKEISQKQIAANQANAKKSTGPRTAAGRDASKLNALKHGILSKAVLVRGTNLQESHQEYMELQERFRRELQPLGPLEEMLVDQIVTTHWRLRRVLAAEASEIALSVDGGQWERSKPVEPQWFGGRMRDDPVSEMHQLERMQRTRRSGKDGNQPSPPAPGTLMKFTHSPLLETPPREVVPDAEPIQNDSGTARLAESATDNSAKRTHFDPTPSAPEPWELVSRNT